MEGRVDFTALDRSRLLSSGSLGGLGPPFSGGDSAHSSSLARFSGGTAAAGAVTGVAPSELARGGSPTALQQYSTRFLPTTNLHTPGTGYAMMAGYLANTGHVPDSLKHLMPEFQQYWSSAMHSEGYARYLFNNMYYPYLSYLPATESLALFAQNSANAAQVQAVLQAQATHHRIYDLQKEALFGGGHGSLPHGFYPPSHTFSAGGQLEATNLSLASGKTKTDVGKESETRDSELKLESDKLTEDHERKTSFHDSDKDKLSERDKMKEKVLEGSERTRGLNSKTDDRDKIKSSKRSHRSHAGVAESSHPHFHSPEISKTDTKSFSPKHLHDAISKCHKINERRHHEEKHRTQGDKPAANESERKSTSSHSPQRHSRLVSPERRSSKTHSPVSRRLNASVSPVELKYNTVPVVQEMPENLCVKDMQRERETDTSSVKVENLSDKTITSCVRTQTLVTGTTVTITSTLNVCTSDTSECGERIEERSKNKALLSPNSKERSQISPSLSHSPTMTTYSLPYYHNLYSRSQCYPQQGKRVHAVTYVPEIGTISSPIAGAPSIIDVVDAAKSDNKKKGMSENSLDSTESSPKGDHVSAKSKGGKVESPSNNEGDDSDGSVDIIVCDNENDVSKDDNEKEISVDGTSKVDDLRNDGGRASKSSDENPSKLFNNKGKRDMPKSNSENNVDSEKSVSLKCLNNKTTSLNSGKKSPPSSENVTSSQLGKEKVVKDKLPVINDPRSEHSILDESYLNEAQDMRKKPIKDKPVSTVHKVNKTSQQEEGQSVCDMNHNSKTRSMDESKSKHDEIVSKPSTAINLSVSDSRESKLSSLSTKTVNENDSKDSRKNENRQNRTNGAQVTSIKPILTQPASVKNDKTCSDNEGSQPPCSIALKTEYQAKVAVVPSTKATEAQILKSSIQKQTDGQMQASVSSIPVGIAVARQRSIAPKVTTEKDSKKATDDARGKGSTPDIKHVRPLKIIRPSTTKVSTPTTAEKRNELPANLIVTGGSATSGVFWPDDPASRQLAAQFLQNGNPITPSSWYGQTSFPFPQNITTPTSDGNHSNQLPLTVPTVPPGYKLAQDSLTGQILLIPAGADIYDTSRVFSGFSIGSQLHQNSTYGTPVLPGQQPTGSLPTTPSLFPGQQTIGDRPPNLDFTVPQYQQVFNAGVLPGTDVIIKDDKTATPGQTGGAMATVVNPTVILPHCAESNPVSSSNDQLTEKDKIIPQTKPTLVPELSVAQQCSYTFPGSALPFVFNSSLIPTHTITDPGTETSHTKHDSMSVQSRGTSPMLPATDSSTEEAEEYLAQTDIKQIDKQQNDNTGVCVKVNQSEEEAEPKSDKKKEVSEKEINVIDIDKNECEKEVIEIAEDSCDDNKDEGKFKKSCDEQKENGKARVEDYDETDNIHVDEKVEKVNVPNKNESGPRTDRNIFTDITEYNPFTDPQVLQAADGLELLSALAEKSSLCSPYKVGSSEVVKETDSSDKSTKCDDVFTFKEDSPPRTIRNVFEEKKRDVKQTDEKVKLERELSVKHDADEKQDKPKPRIKCGHAFLPKLKEDTPIDIPKRVTTFCGITIPEDDEVIDSIELEMKLRLAELQRRYKEKQRELARLTPRRDSEREKDTDKPKLSCEKPGDLKRGPGRPKKRPSDSTSSADKNGEHTSPKSKHLKKEVKDKHAASNTSSNGNGGPSGPTKKKKMAEMIVDRVFRKTGSSFKIPLSKKVSLIAPARIELPGLSPSVDRNEQVRHNKSLDFGKLIKRSRLSQLNGKDRSFDGGFWHKKEDKKKHLAFGSSSLKIKKKKKPKDFSVENGLGLLAEYATKSRDDIEKQKRKAEETPGNTSPDSPNKKRKPGRPKKCDIVRPGVTETIVAKQSKHIDYFRLQTEKPKAERKISLEGKTPLKPLYLDEWNVRRSERIFLSDPSPQTSPNAVSPGTKAKPDDKSKAGDKDTNTEGKMKLEKQKKSRSIDLSQKVKKKYSNGFSQQKAREKTTELLKASRDRLTMKRQENKKKQLSVKKVSSSDSDNDDVPLSAFKPRPKTPDPPKCALEKDSLCDGTRILVFMDGLFHEGELKAIRPPDVYGAILDNERKTRPHYFSQEEILKDAIMDVQATCPGQLKEGIRICAYWSQQFSCLYPGTISRGSPNPSADNNLFNVEFDDGDTGKIPLDHIRIIPQDFPLVEYDPNPLLLLTKRRRTVSVSETSEPRKSHSEPSPAKEGKVKRGPGRPPKTERMLSNVSVGDEDVFIDNNKSKSVPKNESQEEAKSTKAQSDQQNSGRKRDNSAGQIVLRELWTWSGNSTKRPGLKGKAKKEYYKTVVRGSESISVGECAVFLSTGRPNLPYVGRIESFWEAWGGQMIVKVKWFYHPEETKGGKRLQNMKGALFRSDHEDENDCQTISHKCEVISYADYRRRKDVISLDDNDDVYYLAGSYQPTIGHIKFEPGVMVS